MKNQSYSLHDVIQSLRPDNEFTMFDDNPDTIIWNDEGVTTPSKKEIENGRVAFEAAKKAEAQAKLEAKAAAQAKLAALGLTIEDLQALGL